MTNQHQEFETLLDQHQGIVLKVASVYTSNRAEREDLVQEICLQLWRSFPRYDRERASSESMFIGHSASRG